MSDKEDMVIHSAGMINTSVIIFFIAVVFLPWFIGLYAPEIDMFDGKMMLESMSVVGGELLIVGSVFMFLVGSGWLVISTIFYGIEKAFSHNNRGNKKELRQQAGEP
jgi:hypothetical protein